MGIITGFLEGIITTDLNGSPKALPFQDKIEGATFRYMSESLDVETFSAQGIKGRSEACPFREECSIELRTKALAWAFLQAASNTLARDAQINERRTVTSILSVTAGTPIKSTLTLASAPLIGTDIFVGDEDGKAYDVTVSGTTITFDDDYTGTRVTISYEVAPTGENNEIALGSGTKLGQVGVYGRFFGCPESLLIMVNRAIIDANLEFDVESDAASASLTAKAMRDINGNFAVIRRL